MRKKVILVILLLAAVLFMINGCAKNNPVRSKQTDMPKMNLATDLGNQTIIKDDNQAMPTEAVSWSSMSQAERNMAILYRADRDNGKFVNLNCKEWVRRVVLDASGGLVYLPQTLPNESGWYFASSRFLVGMCGGIRSVNQGWIVQMNWRRTDGVIIPHTLIIAGRSPSGINVIECNWCMNNCMTVAYRWISFTDFEARAVLYSCYYVTGG